MHVDVKIDRDNDLVTWLPTAAQWGIVDEYAVAHQQTRERAAAALIAAGLTMLQEINKHQAR